MMALESDCAVNTPSNPSPNTQVESRWSARLSKRISNTALCRQTTNISNELWNSPNKISTFSTFVCKFLKPYNPMFVFGISIFCTWIFIAIPNTSYWLYRLVKCQWWDTFSVIVFIEMMELCLPDTPDVSYVAAYTIGVFVAPFIHIVAYFAHAQNNYYVGVFWGTATLILILVIYGIDAFLRPSSLINFLDQSSSFGEDSSLSTESSFSYSKLYDTLNSCLDANGYKQTIFSALAPESVIFAPSIKSSRFQTITSTQNALQHQPDLSISTKYSESVIGIINTNPVDLANAQSSEIGINNADIDLKGFIKTLDMSDCRREWLYTVTLESYEKKQFHGNELPPLTTACELPEKSKITTGNTRVSDFDRHNDISDSLTPEDFTESFKLEMGVNQLVSGFANTELRKSSAPYSRNNSKEVINDTESQNDSIMNYFPLPRFIYRRYNMRSGIVSGDRRIVWGLGVLFIIFFNITYQFLAFFTNYYVDNDIANNGNSLIPLFMAYVCVCHVLRICMKRVGIELDSRKRTAVSIFFLGEMSSLMYYYTFYRVLFASIRSWEIFAIFQVIHLSSEWILYPLRASMWYFRMMENLTTSTSWLGQLAGAFVNSNGLDLNDWRCFIGLDFGIRCSVLIITGVYMIVMLLSINGLQWICIDLKENETDLKVTIGFIALSVALEVVNAILMDIVCFKPLRLKVATSTMLCFSNLKFSFLCMCIGVCLFINPLYALAFCNVFTDDFNNK